MMKLPVSRRRERERAIVEDSEAAHVEFVLIVVIGFFVVFDRNKFLNERDIDRPELLVFLFRRSTDANESRQEHGLGYRLVGIGMRTSIRFC